MNVLSIKRALNDNTRKQGIFINGEVYSLHITENGEIIITDNSDYTKIYAIHSLDFYNCLVQGEAL
jgi:hypothetical protein